MTIHQVEFLAEGYLLPPTIGTLRVSEELVFEKVWREGTEYGLSHEQTDYAIAYVGVEAPEGSNFFPAAIEYLDFFLLLYCLVSNVPISTMVGTGTILDQKSALGAKRIGWSSFEKLQVLDEREDDLFCKPILDTKKLFLTLLPEKQRIMESSIGLALVFYYFAVLATKTRFEETIINLMIAGEALLIDKERQKKKNLSRRLSVLIAKDEEEKVKVSDRMQKLYKLRSDIVHGEGVKPSDDDVRTLASYVKRAIERCISLRDLTKKQILANLDGV